jgi:hypothetical protein
MHSAVGISIEVSAGGYSIRLTMPVKYVETVDHHLQCLKRLGASRAANEAQTETDSVTRLVRKQAFARGVLESANEVKSSSDLHQTNRFQSLLILASRERYRESRIEEGCIELYYGSKHEIL